MSHSKRILVIFEGLNPRPEAVQYSLALAQRIDAKITFLVLLPNESAGDDPIARGEEVLRKEADSIAAAGVEAEFQIRIGDPRSEFYKFMASRPSFHTAIWGGDEKVLEHGGARMSDHWVSAVGNELYCPLVAPRKR